MRGFRFRSILYSERCAHICLAPYQNSNVWRPNIYVWTHLKPISRYTSTVGSKRRYHSSRMCVDVAGRDSCRFNTIGCLHTYVAKTSISSFHRVGTAFPADSLKPGQFCSSAATLVTSLARLFHDKLRTTFVDESKDLCTSYRLLCVIGNEMSYPPSLKLHDVTPADQ